VPIKGFSENVRMPRLGKIRIGEKVKGARQDGSEYERPVALDHFKCPIEIQELYGEAPTRLPVILATDDIGANLQEDLKMYTLTGGLICKGDGEMARRVDMTTGELIEQPCGFKNCPSYQKGDCKEVGVLSFLMPEVPGHGVWQIVTSSVNSMMDLKSEMKWAVMMTGHIAGIPFELTIEPIEVTPKGQKKKKTIYTLHLRTKLTIFEMKALPPWQAVSPAIIPGDDAMPDEMGESEEEQPVQWQDAKPNGNGKVGATEGPSELPEQRQVHIRASHRGMSKEGCERWLLNNFHTEHTRFMDKEECLAAIAMVDRLTDDEVKRWNEGVLQSPPTDEPEAEPVEYPQVDGDELPPPSDEEAPPEPGGQRGLPIGDEQRSALSGDIRALWVRLASAGAKQFAPAKGRLEGIMELAKAEEIAMPPMLIGPEVKVVDAWLSSGPVEDLEKVKGCLNQLLNELKIAKQKAA